MFCINLDENNILIYPKSSYISSRLHGVVLQKTVALIVAGMGMSHRL